MNRTYLETSCNEIDASIFSGDVLFDDGDRVALREYAERWLRAIDEHEKSIAEDVANKKFSTKNEIGTKKDVTKGG
jgi:hypothetical protein